MDEHDEHDERALMERFRESVVDALNATIARLDRDLAEVERELEIVKRDRDALKKDNVFAGEQIEEANRRIRDLSGRSVEKYTISRGAKPPGDQYLGRYQDTSGRPLGEGRMNPPPGPSGASGESLP